MFLGGGTMDDNQLKLVLNDPLLGPATHNPEVWLWCIIHEAEHVSEEKSLQKNSSEQLPVLTSVLDLDKFDSGKYKKQTTITSSN